MTAAARRATSAAARAFAFIVPPVVSAVIALPLLLGGEAPRDWVTALVLSPLAIGIASAPGYGVAAVQAWRPPEPRARPWVVASVIGMFYAGCVGVGGSSWMILFLPSSLWVAVASAILLVELAGPGRALPTALALLAAFVALTVGVVWALGR